MYLKRTTSTMDVVQQLFNVSSEMPSVSLFLAESQSTGRGRENRAWNSATGLNLLFTILLHPSGIEQLRKINLAGCCAVVRTCKDEGVDAGIKWPNDVWVKGKKLSGMLLDSSVLGSSFTASLGIGINLNEDMNTNSNPEVRMIATSMFNIINKKS